MKKYIVLQFFLVSLLTLHSDLEANGHKRPRADTSDKEEYGNRSASSGPARKKREGLDGNAISDNGTSSSEAAKAPAAAAAMEIDNNEAAVPTAANVEQIPEDTPLTYHALVAAFEALNIPLATTMRLRITSEQRVYALILNIYGYYKNEAAKIAGFISFKHAVGKFIPDPLLKKLKLFNKKTNPLPGFVEESSARAEAARREAVRKATREAAARKEALRKTAPRKEKKQEETPEEAAARKEEARARFEASKAEWEALDKAEAGEKQRDLLERAAQQMTAIGALPALPPATSAIPGSSPTSP